MTHPTQTDEKTPREEKNKSHLWWEKRKARNVEPPPFGASPLWAPLALRLALQFSGSLVLRLVTEEICGTFGSPPPKGNHCRDAKRATTVGGSSAEKRDWCVRRVSWSADFGEVTHGNLLPEV